MTKLEIILSITLYFVMFALTYQKQLEALKKSGSSASAPFAFFSGLFWPVVVTVYAVRAVFFEDWL